MPYERVIAWAAGPISIIAGLLASAAEQHFHWLGPIIGTSAVARAITYLGTFAVGAAVTYAAHHKWLDNLAKWWATGSGAPPATVRLKFSPPVARFLRHVETPSVDESAPVNQSAGPGKPIPSPVVPTPMHAGPGRGPDDMAHFRRLVTQIITSRERAQARAAARRPPRTEPAVKTPTHKPPKPAKPIPSAKETPK